MNKSSVSALVLATIALTVLAKAGALARDIALAAMFGAGPAVDAYFVANVVPGLLWLAFLTTITAVFLPIYVKEREKGAVGAAQIAIEAVRVYVMLGALMLVVTFLLAPQIVALTAPGKPAEFQQLATTLTRITALGFVFTGYVGVQNALQQANGRYLWPLAAQPLNHVITIAAIFAAAAFADIRIAVAGAALGWLVQAPIQRWQTLQDYSTRLGLKVRRQTARRLALLSAPVIVAVFLDQANIYIGVAIAARFGEGAVSHLGYASRLTLFLANLVSWVVAYFLFPRLAAHVARGDDGGTAKDLAAGTVIICALTLPMVVVSVLFGRQIIAVIFGRGAFGEGDVLASAAVFLPYTLGILAIGMREMLNRVFFSYQKTVTPMVIGFVAAAINLGCSLYLSRLYGVPGIAMGASIAALAFLLMQLAVIASWRRGLLGGLLLARVGALGAAAMLALGAGQYVLPLVQGWPDLAAIAMGGAVLGLVYLAAVLALDRLLGLRMMALVLALKGSSK